MAGVEGIERMIFRKTASAEPPGRYLADSIARELAGGKRVLWLVPGGSAISVALCAASLLKNQSLDNLTVSLTDERYGEVGHPDSNWQQLMDQGFLLPGATLCPVLIGQAKPETISQFDTFLRHQLLAAEYAIGLFGIGADGHTAGILPDSVAVRATSYACGYPAGAFYRITTTALTIGALDEAVVFAMGEEKRPVLDQLEVDIPSSQQPAQLLKQVSRLTVYNDYKGEVV